MHLAACAKKTVGLTEVKSLVQQFLLSHSFQEASIRHQAATSYKSISLQRIIELILSQKLLLVQDEESSSPVIDFVRLHIWPIPRGQSIAENPLVTKIPPPGQLFGAFGQLCPAPAPTAPVTCMKATDKYDDKTVRVNNHV